MNPDNQKEYWDKVADVKTFSHPVDIDLLLEYINPDSTVVDFGCGYGRLVQQLYDAGFTNTTGYDTSLQLINRGRNDALPVYHIDTPQHIPLADNSVDCILLFAVLTCIPSNRGQLELIKLLLSKLKPRGIIYISDYYLQQNETAQSRYTHFNDDTNNFGVFTLPEGATFRHHTHEWITTLLQDLVIKEEHLVPVKTMNGNQAEAFQVIASK